MFGERISFFLQVDLTELLDRLNLDLAINVSLGYGGVVDRVNDINL